MRGGRVGSVSKDERVPPAGREPDSASGRPLAYWHQQISAVTGVTEPQRLIAIETLMHDAAGPLARLDGRAFRAEAQTAAEIDRLMQVARSAEGQDPARWAAALGEEDLCAICLAVIHAVAASAGSPPPGLTPGAARAVLREARDRGIGPLPVGPGWPDALEPGM